MLIKSVLIENFKRFERLDIDLRPFDCLVGPNNSGKTTLLQALALFDFCVNNCLSRRNGTIEIRNRSIVPEEFYVLPVSNTADLWTDRRLQTRNRHIFIQITVAFVEGHKVTAAIDLSYNRFAVSLQSTEQSQAWLEQLAQFKISYLPVFSTFLPQEERRTPAVIADELARGRVNSVIRNLLLDLKKANRQSELVEILGRAFPDLTDIAIEFDEVSDRYISVTYKEKGHPKEFDVFSAGSGFQQFIYLFGFIMLRQPVVILLDEPDVHLHGTLQQALLEELRRLVESGKQVLFATHSRDLIARMSPENILVLESGSAKRLAVAFDIYDALDTLGSVEVTQLPVIQAYRRVLVVEDQSDWNLLSTFCTTVLGTTVWQQVERRLAICYAKGNPWKQDMARLRQQLQQMITIQGQPLEMFVVADRDYHPDLSELRQSLPSEHLVWHIWERAEIENYLLSEEGILNTIRDRVGKQKTQLSLDEAAFHAEFERLLESSRDPADDLLSSALGEYSNKHRKGWDAGTINRKAREYLQQHWQVEKLALADAKKIVLPGIKRWLQEQGLGQFSDKALAEVLKPENLPQEVHELAQNLARFVGVSAEGGI
jgi:ABC-type cobalamin/Fe3+-siderophores transport system ATPase subunit